jgi:hypothetical protein
VDVGRFVGSYPSTVTLPGSGLLHSLRIGFMPCTVLASSSRDPFHQQVFVGVSSIPGVAARGLQSGDSAYYFNIIKVGVQRDASF